MRRLLAVSLAQDKTTVQLSSSVLCVPHTLALTLAPLLSVLWRPQLSLPPVQYRQVPLHLMQVRTTLTISFALPFSLMVTFFRNGLATNGKTIAPIENPVCIKCI